uniref:Uncharacterized protein n=1 Tax=Pediastrum duplex TaxID=3105 RepID=A0A1W5RMM6_PEDDU|nr:hypothetical protein [Pediastrum duplex]AQU64453.1 hypothetical protein [Pediastrum duplex]
MEIKKIIFFLFSAFRFFTSAWLLLAAFASFAPSLLSLRFAKQKAFRFFASATFALATPKRKKQRREGSRCNKWKALRLFRFCYAAAKNQSEEAKVAISEKNRRNKENLFYFHLWISIKSKKYYFFKFSINFS